MATAVPIRYEWRGSDPRDGHLNGVPARDLTDDDWQALDESQQKAVWASELWKPTRRASDDRKRYAAEADELRDAIEQAEAPADEPTQQREAIQTERAAETVVEDDKPSRSTGRR